MEWYIGISLSRLYRSSNAGVHFWHGISHLSIPSSFWISLVRLNCRVLCHGNKVRVTGSFLRRSCSTSKGNDYVYSLGGIIITMKEDIQLGKGMIMCTTTTDFLLNHCISQKGKAICLGFSN
jgi:hypothetical protein